MPIVVVRRAQHCNRHYGLSWLNNIEDSIFNVVEPGQTIVPIVVVRRAQHCGKGQLYCSSARYCSVVECRAAVVYVGAVQ